MMFDDYNYSQLNDFIFSQVLETLHSEDGDDDRQSISIFGLSKGSSKFLEDN